MARGSKRHITRILEMESQSPAAATVEKILLALKPDRDITAGEFLKRAFTFPQIDKIKVQKFVVGTWNFAEDLDNLGPTFETGKIEEYLKEKYGAWRFRLLAVVQGEVITQHLINLDGWQENEGRAAANAPSSRGPMTPGARVAGPGATGELLATARERLEIENTMALLAGIGQKKTVETTDATFAPYRMMAETMTAMMTMMREMMVSQRGGMTAPQEDRFLTYLQSEIQFLREQALKPAQQRDPDALSKTITTIDGLLQSALNTSLAEMLTATKGTEATGWTATIQGIIEGVKPYLPDIMMAIKSAAPAPARPALTKGNVIPLRPGATPPDTTNGGDEMKAGVNPELVEILNLMIDSLNKKDFETVDALLSNPPLRGQFNINPNTPGSVYALMFKVVDPRFATMGPQISAYLEHVKQLIADDEAANPDTE